MYKFLHKVNFNIKGCDTEPPYAIYFVSKALISFK